MANLYATEKNYKASVEQILAAVNDKTKIVFIANPNNPTGTYLGRSEIVNIMNKIQKHVIVVLDGAYAEYVNKDDYDNGFSLVKEFEWGKSDLVVAVPTTWIDCVNSADLEEISFEFYKKKKRLMRVATKFPNLTSSWLNSRGITQYELISSLGATENSHIIGKSDLIVDLSSTGETLRQNNLKTIEVILKSSACLFTSKKLKNKKKVKKIVKLLSR